MNAPGRGKRRNARAARRLGWLTALVLALPLAVLAAGPDNACGRCHPAPGVFYLESLAGPQPPAAGCPVLARLAERLQAVEGHFMDLEKTLARSRAAGEYVEPGARRLERAKARLAWLWGLRLESEAQARGWLVELDRELEGRVAPDLARQAARERRRIGVALALVAGLGLALAWLVGRRRELGVPGLDPLEELRQGRLP